MQGLVSSTLRSGPVLKSRDGFLTDRATQEPPVQFKDDHVFAVAVLLKDVIMILGAVQAGLVLYLRTDRRRRRSGLQTPACPCPSLQRQLHSPASRMLMFLFLKILENKQNAELHEGIDSSDRAPKFLLMGIKVWNTWLKLYFTWRCLFKNLHFPPPQEEIKDTSSWIIWLKFLCSTCTAHSSWNRWKSGDLQLYTCPVKPGVWLIIRILDSVNWKQLPKPGMAFCRQGSRGPGAVFHPGRINLSGGRKGRIPDLCFMLCLFLFMFLFLFWINYLEVCVCLWVNPMILPWMY